MRLDRATAVTALRIDRRDGRALRVNPPCDANTEEPTQQMMRALLHASHLIASRRYVTAIFGNASAESRNNVKKH